MLSTWQLRLTEFVQTNILARPVKRICDKVFKMGCDLYPQQGFTSPVYPSPNNIPFDNLTPEISNALFIGPSTHIFGNVTLGEKTVVMFNSFLECISASEKDQIRVGERTIIQDLVLIKANQGQSVHIGRNCFVGANTSIENSTVEEGVYIGPACRVVNSTIRKGAYLAPGTWVVDGEVGAGLVVCKSPFEVLREVSVDEVEYVYDRLKENLSLALIIANFHEKNTATIFCETPSYVDHTGTFSQDSDNTYEDYEKELRNANLPSTMEDLYYADYRDWMLEQMEDRKTFSYKDNEFEPSQLTFTNEDLFSTHQEDLEKHLELHKRGEERKGKLIEPDFSFDTEEFDYKREIEKRNDEASKF